MNDNVMHPRTYSPFLTPYITILLLYGQLAETIPIVNSSIYTSLYQQNMRIVSVLQTKLFLLQNFIVNTLFKISCKLRPLFRIDKDREIVI